MVGVESFCDALTELEGVPRGRGGEGGGEPAVASGHGAFVCRLLRESWRPKVVLMLEENMSSVITANWRLSFLTPNVNRFGADPKQIFTIPVCNDYSFVSLQGSRSISTSV